MGLVNRGWERGQAQDAGWVGWFSKAVGDGLEVGLELEPGTVVGDLSYEPKQKLPAITLRKAGTWDGQGPVNFEHLHPIVASEVLRDVELLAAFEEKLDAARRRLSSCRRCCASRRGPAATRAAPARRSRCRRSTCRRGWCGRPGARVAGSSEHASHER